MHWPTFSLNRHVNNTLPCRAASAVTPFLGLLFIAPATLAQETDTHWEVGVSSQYFDYEETSPDGTTLNTEQGWLPGFYVSGNRSLPGDVQLAVRVSRAKGTVDYEGATQSGQALSTDTSETLTRVGARLSTPLPDALPDSLSAFFGLEYTRWNRKIQATSQSGQLFEHYRWYELSGGLQHCTAPLDLNAIERLCATASLTRTLNGTMVVRLNDLNLGNPELNLGDKWGGEASLRLDLAGPVVARLFTKMWKHGASNPVTIQQKNGYVRITEPASQSWLTGVEVGVRF
jgi:hypothetical protein